jgi:glyoxylase-like metal-dependent hydrolase (beta-lactamase superfamily II)
LGSVLVVATLAGGAHLAGQAQRPADQRPPGAVSALHVQGNVWMLAGRTSNAAVQIGNDGVLVVDTMTAELADDLIAEVRRLAGDRPIRYIVNTHAHADHTGGNEKMAAAGRSIVSGNVVGDIGLGAANYAAIIAHENVLTTLSNPASGAAPAPSKALPSSTFFTGQKDIYFNGEAVELIHIANAHTDGDVMVYFRRSDVLVAGDLFVTTTFPVIDKVARGDVTGVLAGLNRILDITVPRDKQEGGTYVIPGHGRLTDEADVLDYRDMVTIVRDRVGNAIEKKLTTDQVRAAKFTRDYDTRYGGPEGSVAAQFVEAADKSLRPVPAPAVSNRTARKPAEGKR